MIKILSIDCGRIRGLIPALVLAGIETWIGKVVSDCFDLTADTSAGGILALGFARDDGSCRPRYSAKDLAGIYSTKGKKIFHGPFEKGRCPWAGWQMNCIPTRGLTRCWRNISAVCPWVRP